MQCCYCRNFIITGRSSYRKHSAFTRWPHSLTVSFFLLHFIMKKLFFVPFALILLFVACTKDNNIITSHEEAMNAKEDNISIVVPAPDGTTDRSLCNLYCKIAYRRTATYSNAFADFLPCYYAFRIVQVNAAGNRTVVFPQSGGYFGAGLGASAGSNLTMQVTNTPGFRYFVEFDTVQNPTGNPNANATNDEHIYVFFADNVAVHNNPVPNADVSWERHTQIGPVATPDVETSRAFMSSSCVVTPN
jgi:hypothetical protein